MSIETLPRPLSTTPAPKVSRSFLTRVWQGPVEQERWVRPALFGLLSATAFLDLWGLGSSGWANSFYSAAAQAGSESWKALFFGSSDAANSITVDKPPMSLWIIGLSVRTFGLSSWAILVPQALMGVASVGLLYATVRRTVDSAGAGLLAGAVLALTPVAALMFRFNNPDALLVLLLIGAAGATLRAIQATWAPAGKGHPTRWLAVAGMLVGFAFLTKMLQAFLVLPGFALAFLLVSGKGYGYAMRLRDLAVAFAALVVSAGWWVTIVALWPASDRPYIGGSQHNSILELVLGYNGFGRLSGNETGSVGGGGGPGGGAGGWGSTGWLRMLSSEVAGQVGWLLPAAVLLLVAGLWLALRDRHAGATAGLVVFGCWLLVTAATFSFMRGIFHAYYTVALAPAIAAVVAIGATLLWRHRRHLAAALTLAGATTLAVVTSFVLLSRTPDFYPWLRWLILVVGIGSALALAAGGHLTRFARTTVAAVAVTAVLAGPASYAIDTMTTPHTGSIPTAGPGSFGPGGGGMTAGGPRGLPPGAAQNGAGFPGGQGTFPGGRGTFPGGRGTFPGGQGTFPRGTSNPGAQGAAPGDGGTGAPAGVGGLLDASTPSAALTTLLKANAGDFTWVAATIGANNASGFQLATQLSVMPIGGFNGSDPSPTLAQFKADVAAGRIHYFIGSGTGAGIGGMGGGGLSPGGSTRSQISAWVANHFTAKTVGGVTLYDLSGGAK